jgi:hypothetical protein
MPLRKPTYNAMWANFTTIYGSGDLVSVGNKIGGKVKVNIDLGVTDPNLGFTNGCAIRMSYALNKSGTLVPRGEWKTVSGDNGNWYIYRVKDLIKFLNSSFGKPDKTVKNPKPTDFHGESGILVFTVDWRDATGHATLWNGTICSDHCHFPVASEAFLWSLK